MNDKMSKLLEQIGWLRCNNPISTKFSSQDISQYNLDLLISSFRRLEARIATVEDLVVELIKSQESEVDKCPAKKQEEKPKLL